VEVWIFSDRLEVRSPGELLPSVSLESLKGRKPVHASRNPRLTRVLAELGLMREQGEGVPRIFDEMEESWLPMPELTLGEGQFTVTLRNTPVFEGGRPEWLTYVRGLPLNIRQQRILAKNEGGSFRSGEYQDLNDVDRDQAYRELKVMVEAGYLDGPDHPGQGAIYRVRAALPSGPSSGAPPLAAGAQAFRSRMDSKGFVKNRDYQDCFGVERQAATKSLGELVEARVLARAEGERRYKPGPAWEGWGRPAQ
jgi:ATP-dependent DNA helicase RecG